MAEIGALEVATQNRLLDLFQKDLGYVYMGNLEDKPDNSNIDETLLREYLVSCNKYNEKQINQTVLTLRTETNNYGKDLYEANKEIYSLLCYGVNVTNNVGENNTYVYLIDWENPMANNFYIAEEVTVFGVKERRPDLIIYVNGIALAVIELKRSKVSVHDGIRQNIRNQQDNEIHRFFTTIQLLFAGNDTEGLHYGVIKTPEKFWLRWKEENPKGERELDYSCKKFFDKTRFLEFIQDMIIFDAGIKKAARPNQYFALKAAQPRVKSKKSGIIWHSQGSGKSLTMIWLAKWIRRTIGGNSRVVIITDRDELDRQIENGFKNTQEQIIRSRTRRELIELLNQDSPWLISTLIHKFGVKNDEDTIKIGDKKANVFIQDYLKQIEDMLPKDFEPKGNFYVFVDECHRTQGGRLHEAMKKIMGDNVMIIGFTGTPLFKEDKKTSEQTFGTIIHSYKFNEAVEDKVILDLRYEARDIEQRLADENKFDTWFETKTQGLSTTAKELLKERWVRLENIFSSRERIQRIVKDICYDMDMKLALKGGYGNAILVAGSIYQACKYYEEFEKTQLKGYCALVTSYEPYGDNNPEDIRTDGDEEKVFKNYVTNKLLGGRFSNTKDYEQWAKNKFINEPGGLKLMIVVDKLLTGFDAPSATYLYIDKQMRDHNLFQAICRVNRVDKEEKEYGYIIDYQDLFGAITDSINTYTGGAFENYEEEDIEGLLLDRLENAKKDLDDALDKVNYILEVVPQNNQEDYFAYFVYKETTPIEEQEKEAEENAQKRVKLYKLVNNLVNRYIAIATEMIKAGYSEQEAREIKIKVDYYNDLKDEIKLKSGDKLDLKLYDPAMRKLLDDYIRADDSKLLINMEDISFLDIIYNEGEEAINKLPNNIKTSEKAVAELLVANMRQMVNSERPTNPKYFNKLSLLINELLNELKDGKIKYKDLIGKLIDHIRDAKNINTPNFPTSINTIGLKSLYMNLNNNEDLAIKVHNAVIKSAENDFRDSRTPLKLRKVKIAVSEALGDYSADNLDEIMKIIIAQREY